MKINETPEIENASASPEKLPTREQTMAILNDIHREAKSLAEFTDFTAPSGDALRERYNDLSPEARRRLHVALKLHYKTLSSFAFDLRNSQINIPS